MYGDRETISLMKENIKRLEGAIQKNEDDRVYYSKVHSLDMEHLKREQDLLIEAARNEIRKDLHKALLESDLKRVKAESALATYEKMDTKDERKAVQKMLETAITGLSQQKVNIVK